MRIRGYNLLYACFLGGNANATASCWKPAVLCEPSQNGLFFDCPHLHRPITSLPARSYVPPVRSIISKSPSTFIEPLLLIVILVAATCGYFGTIVMHFLYLQPLLRSMGSRHSAQLFGFHFVYTVLHEIYCFIFRNSMHPRI